MFVKNHMCVTPKIVKSYFCEGSIAKSMLAIDTDMTCTSFLMVRLQNV